MENTSKPQNFLGIDKSSLNRIISDPKEVERAWKALENFKNNKIIDDYDFFNKLSLGNGSRAYNKYTFDKISNSLEYVSLFQYIKNKKTFNLDTDDGMNLHIYRNKNQYHKAPKDFDTMKEFIKAGYFIFEGFSPCHNLEAGHNDYKSRKHTLSTCAYLITNKVIYKPNQYSPKYNISCRGTPGTSFEGCQFIYNYKTGELVTDNINRGTWDYGKYATFMHFTLDIYPWLRFGNGDNIETSEQFIMTDVEQKLYFTPEALERAKEARKKYNNFIMSNKLVIQEWNNYIKWDNAIHNNKLTIVSGKDEKDIINNKIESSKEEFIDEEYLKASQKRYVENSISNIDMAYKDAWYNYVLFLTYVESRELTQGMDNIINYIETDPISFRDIITVPEEKEKYGEFLFKSAFILKPEERKVGSKILTKLPIKITVWFSPEVKDSILDVKNKLGDTEARNQAHFYRDTIVDAFNKRIEKYNFEVRFISDFIDFSTDFDHFELEIRQIRNVSESEATILNNKVLSLNAKRFIENNKDLEHPDNNVINKNLVNPCLPEYFERSDENLLTSGAIAILSLTLITLVLGGTKLIKNKINENKVKKFSKELAPKLVKLFGDTYDQMYKTNKDIKTKMLSDNIIRHFDEIDKYGVYNLYEPEDFGKKEEFINNLSNKLLLNAKSSKTYESFVNIFANEYHNIILVDGYLCKDVYSDPSLLDELTKFEYGVNSDDQNTKISYIQELSNKTYDKLYFNIDNILKSFKNNYIYGNRSNMSINWSRVGREPIENQEYFKIGYTQYYKIDWTELKEIIEALIRKLN